MAFNIRKIVIAFSGIFAIAALTACSPEVGSKDWCEDLKAKPKGEWTANEVTDFAKNCVL
ncbi:MAG: DUF3012 domain-containing protein [Rhodospirillales bacterium]|nr:DUF3012 domain-containing protein [Rhodospirillales bacterium]